MLLLKSLSWETSACTCTLETDACPEGYAYWYPSTNKVFQHKHPKVPRLQGLSFSRLLWSCQHFTTPITGFHRSHESLFTLTISQPWLCLIPCGHCLSTTVSSRRLSISFSRINISLEFFISLAKTTPLQMHCHKAIICVLSAFSLPLPFAHSNHFN